MSVFNKECKNHHSDQENFSIYNEIDYDDNNLTHIKQYKVSYYYNHEIKRTYTYLNIVVENISESETKSIIDEIY